MLKRFALKGRLNIKKSPEMSYFAIMEMPTEFLFLPIYLNLPRCVKGIAQQVMGTKQKN